jgi:hypothetical protein
MISNYAAKYNEPLPFSQIAVIAAHLLTWIGLGRFGQHVHATPDTSHTTANVMHSMGVEEERG